MIECCTSQSFSVSFSFSLFTLNPISLLSHSPADAIPSQRCLVTSPIRIVADHRVKLAQANEERCVSSSVPLAVERSRTDYCVLEKKNQEDAAPTTNRRDRHSPTILHKGRHTCNRKKLMFSCERLKKINVAGCEESHGVQSISARDRYKTQHQCWRGRRACCSGTLLPLGFQANNAKQMQGG